MMNLSMSQLLACVLLLTMSLTTSAISAGGVTMRTEMTHVDSRRGFTRWELLTRMAARSRARAASLHHRGGGGNYGHAVTAPGAPGTVGRPMTEYLIHFAIGTPQPQHVALTLDTGSCWDRPSALAGIDRRLLVGSTVGSEKRSDAQPQTANRRRKR
jgi:hypothetical protein